MKPVLAWFRDDLRLSDNLALGWAVQTGSPVIPVFILDEEPGTRAAGTASRRWLHGSLQALTASLGVLGSRLILRRGAPAAVLEALARETKAWAVCWNRRYDPVLSGQDRAVEAQLRAAGLEMRTFNSALLVEPREIRTGNGSPYKVFAPFWRRCLAQDFRRPLRPPLSLPLPTTWPASEPLEVWQPGRGNPEWPDRQTARWRPGEVGALSRLEDFIQGAASTYATNRDKPGTSGTSRLSPHLHFGEVGPCQIADRLARSGRVRAEDAYLRQLGWREFSQYLLFHNPDLGTANLQDDFDRMPWRNSPADLRRWQQGQTGYPLVDAGMRELLATGWMHNRVRMVVASFLTKHLLIDWRSGADWFWQTLVDADWANNSTSWQWVAGTGTDAAPCVRVFNPVAQSRRFDPVGGYVRTWVPELGRMPNRFIHAPWTASAPVLAEAGVRLGKTYPAPMVDHTEARQRALRVYRSLVRGDRTASRRG